MEEVRRYFQRQRGSARSRVPLAHECTTLPAGPSLPYLHLFSAPSTTLPPLANPGTCTSNARLSCICLQLPQTSRSETPTSRSGRSQQRSRIFLSHPTPRVPDFPASRHSHSSPPGSHRSLSSSTTSQEGASPRVAFPRGLLLHATDAARPRSPWSLAGHDVTLTFLPSVSDPFVLAPASHDGPDITQGKVEGRQHALRQGEGRERESHPRANR